jgi:hypothetical protein
MSVKALCYVASVAVILAFALFAFAGDVSKPAQISQDRRTTLQSEFERVWTQIQQAKTHQQEIEPQVYDRFFELEALLYPERRPVEQGGRHTLDQGQDNCPGWVINQTAPGQPFEYHDFGTNVGYHNSCTLCRPGRDLIYTLVVNHTDSIQINTCGSQYDTYLCIFRDSCCSAGGTLIFSNDDSPVCGTHSITSAVSECFNPGTYYIVVDGYGAGSVGPYWLSVRGIPGSTCGSEPPIQCPETFRHHTESQQNDEAPCEFGTEAFCGDRFCGAIDGQGDIDVFYLNVDIGPERQVGVVSFTFSLYANDTPGHTGYHRGLDPIIQLFSSPCEAAFYANDDFQGSNGAPEGHDSRIVTECLPGGTYWLEVSSAGSVGPYELFVDCDYCGPSKQKH